MSAVQTQHTDAQPVASGGASRGSGAQGQQWWRDAVIYQIYPRSFADGDGDGIGDLPGITSRLAHLAALGVDAVWLSPFYRSPQVDAGYDVADYRDVDPLFGTLADFDVMVARATELGLRVVVDLVPNHSSSKHVWFLAALQAEPGSIERARYIFRDGRGVNGDLPPNNWRSVFGGAAWTRTTTADGTPGQWYLHIFDKEQPDLNWANPEVAAEFDDVLRFWLDRGVAGFRVDVAHGLVKDPLLPDVEHPDVVGALGQEEVGDRGPMWDQEGVHEIYRAWHRTLAEYDGDRLLVAEAWAKPLSRVARYVRPDEMSQAFNFSFLAARWDATVWRSVIDQSLAANDEVGAPTTWVLSNHDVVRHASAFGLGAVGARPAGIGVRDPQPDAALGLRRARAATLLMLALPGSSYVYQGEELGLPEHTALPDELRQDPQHLRTGGAQAGRDGCRVPLPWEATAAAFGFSPTGASWLPQPEEWADLAVDAQTGRAGSTLELYRAALAIRRAHGLGRRSLVWAEGDVLAHNPQVTDGSVIAFVTGDVLAMANLGQQPVAVPPGWEVIVASEPLETSLGGVVTVPSDVAVWLHRPLIAGHRSSDRPHQ